MHAALTVYKSSAATYARMHPQTHAHTQILYNNITNISYSIQQHNMQQTIHFIAYIIICSMLEIQNIM